MDLTQLQIDQLEASREDYSIRAAADGVVIGASLEPGVTVVPGQRRTTRIAATGTSAA